MARRRREPETARIESVTHDGRGIAGIDGKKTFVAGALAGETVQFIRRKSRRNFDEAELLEVIEASSDRIDARCEAFGRCGGCSLQHVTPQHQRDIKAQTLRDNLERIGKVEPRNWLPPMTGPEWHYRRRARLAVKHVPAKGRTLVGFRERHAPFITDMHRCEVLAKPVDDMIDGLSELIGRLSIRARLPQIEVAVADNVVALVFRVLDTPTDDDKAALCAFGELKNVRIYLQPGGPNSVALLYPSSANEPLYYMLGEFGIKVAFEPIDFVQVNREINDRMVHFAVEQLQIDADDRVLDLYCGIGNFSLPIARRAGTVLGVEGEASLVARAAENARRNDLTNAEFRVADLGKIDGTEAWIKAGWDRMLLDPARSGAAEVVSRMHLFGPERIVYVSCHPGTLARDAGLLVHEQGYTLDTAGIIDMFPHTAHVESIAIFTKT
ncbi:MAG: 23S rRNA (uracil(1939)-C(5))-methyltransferase RlmD [Gammaproteobacteria bacterium]|nr:23S rRNA (uracil(1939)-C(5))-methyltransferase RlmD [Gammaproteobacteria bacterium]NNC56433.1 23S rRNA (uracil(1939)-C(5))-methyltransferase RlmD [Woeseiaceae bacterium]NNL50754.1 23S rRNA (uracil(1939)-C(5))-methyltransferase RlmD [Woeseiaceae bacterium]